MNVPIPSALPASPPRLEAPRGDLDARIRQAEQRLVTRQDNLHQGFLVLGLRLRQGLQPRRLLMPALVAGAALLGLLWLLRRRRHTAAPHGAAATLAPHAPRTPGHWIGLVGLVWPMLPSRWRARVDPALARLALGTGLPLLDVLLGRARPPPLATAGPIDRSLMLGSWFELGRLWAAGEGAAAVRWQHALRADGAIHLLRERVDAQGGSPAPGGVAVAVAGSGGARWRVSHWPAAWRWLPMAWHQEAVLHLDDAATELLLGSPERDRLRVLSRRPNLPRARLDALRAIAAERGFAVDQLHFVDGAVCAGRQ